MQVLVYGFYFKGNVGDDLFIDAFTKLFPQYNFTFTDHITKKHLEGISAVFFGGGSFLDGQPEIEEGAVEIILSKKIFYIGVGIETDIHPTHLKLMRAAKLIAARSNLEKLKDINKNVIYIPDLVYSLGSATNKSKDKGILYIPNIATVPQHFDPHWKHVFWDRFKLEFSQVLDYLFESKYAINIFAMSKNRKLDDSWAGIEVVNQMKYRRRDFFIEHNTDYVNLFSKYQLVITQRYHGIILAELGRTPYISLHHHDKLKRSYLNEGSFLSYYEISKDNLIKEINNRLNTKCSDILPIDNNIFRELKHRVSYALSG